MAKLKSQSQKYVELKEEDYLLLIENTIKMEALKIAGYSTDCFSSDPSKFRLLKGLDILMRLSFRIMTL